MSTIGMMSGAFFVPRTQIIDWLNNTFKLSVAKVEQASNGAIFCQIFDSLFPGKVTMSRVNWGAKTDYDSIQNFKILQQAFLRCEVSRNVPVETLVRGKYQDNLEFLQWAKSFWDQAGGCAGDYDAVARRASSGKSLPDWALPGSADKAPPAKAPASKPVAKPAAPKRVPSDRAAKGAQARPPKAARPAPKATTGSRQFTPASRGPGDSRLENDIKMRDEEIDELRVTVTGLERERDFYYGKLRDIEILCQRFQEQPDPETTPEELVDHILELLYAEDELEEDDAGVTDSGGVPAEPSPMPAATRAPLAAQEPRRPAQADAPQVSGAAPVDRRPSWSDERESGADSGRRGVDLALMDSLAAARAVQAFDAAAAEVPDIGGKGKGSQEEDIPRFGMGERGHESDFRPAQMPQL
mmetsp:Transcript_27228/g.65575  ORF Transcript_27228/g.65575 Transcript_27228/m.65575 type:complete len:412 (+) Transcript_27228:50-1285(+)